MEGRAKLGLKIVELKIVSKGLIENLPTLETIITDLVVFGEGEKLAKKLI